MNNNADYNRIIHIYGHRDFVHCDESTSYIESIWADLKRILYKGYIVIKSENFIYILKEFEWSKIFANLSNSEKWVNIQFILTQIAETP